MSGDRLADLRTVEDADIYKGGRLAAWLHRNDDDVLFDYDVGYLADGQAPAVATTLPKVATTVRATTGSVPPFLDASNTSADDFAQVFDRATSSDPGQLDRSALPGVQVKVSAAMIAAPVGTTAGPAILKLNPESHPRLVENEHFFLSAAASCGLVVPKHQLVFDAHGRPGLLVQRFDRVREPDGTTRRLAQEDAC